MKQYHQALRDVLENGNQRGDRTGTGTISKFGVVMEYDLKDGFPAVTTKKLAFKTMTNELLWFLRGSTKVSELQEEGCKIWDEWQHEDGTIGPMYGMQWRDFNNEGVDQLQDVIDSIKSDPNSRRHIMTTFNPAQKDKGVLYPCHGISIQFYVNNGRLSCMTHQRSGDMFLGVPFNIASYALLTHIIAYHCNLGIDKLVYTIGDAHIYNNHIEQVERQLSRPPLMLPLLDMRLDAPRHIISGEWYKLHADHFQLKDYNHYAAIKGAVSV